MSARHYSDDPEDRLSLLELIEEQRQEISRLRAEVALLKADLEAEHHDHNVTLDHCNEHHVDKGWDR